MGAGSCRYEICGCGFLQKDDGKIRDCKHNSDCPACKADFGKIGIAILVLFLFLALMYFVIKSSLKQQQLRRSYYLDHGATSEQADALASPIDGGYSYNYIT